MGDEAHPGNALADEEAAIDPGQPDGVDAEIAETGDQLAVDDAAEHGRGDLERGLIGDPEALLELRWDTEPVEPLGDPLPATVDEHDRPTSRDRGHLVEDLRLVRNRRATELDDENLAHVVYSEFSMT